MQQVIHALAFDHKYVLPVVVLDPPSILNELQNLRVRVARRSCAHRRDDPDQNHQRQEIGNTRVHGSASVDMRQPQPGPLRVGKTDHQVWGSWTLVPPYRLDLVAFRWAS